MLIGMLELLGVMAIPVLILIACMYFKARRLKQMTPQERAQELARQKESAARRATSLDETQHGSANSALVCPHCQARGSVRTKAVTQKKGVSGGKATAALLTGGVSMLATGLSRKEKGTQAHCDHCGMTWSF
jgi:hypothetical protein